MRVKNGETRESKGHREDVGGVLWGDNRGRREGVIPSLRDL